MMMPEKATAILELYKESSLRKNDVIFPYLKGTNFNDAKDVNSLNDLRKAMIDILGEKGAYNKLRKVGTYFGSPEGEGSPIELNLGQLNV